MRLDFLSHNSAKKHYYIIIWYKYYMRNLISECHARAVTAAKIAIWVK